MAAPDGISWGSIYGSYGRLGIYSKVTTSGATATVNVQVWFWSKYSVTDNNNTFYYNVGTSVSEATTSQGSVDIKHTVASGTGWSTSNQTRLINKTYTYTMGKSAVTYKVYASFKNIDKVGTMMYDNATFKVPAKPSYSVKYNANGGSGAPGTQTKWYGETLKLSTTKPTRTGYTFQGWGTTATDTSVNYAAGANYTSNAAITLYAIWKINTYSVKYNANGGSGAPGTQTKTYGKTLTLSSTKPTRTGYTFQGWGTTATDTSVNYAAGASYTANAAITLYAIWKLNTYSVKYNANGGSGAPSTQTKSYGVTLKLSTTIPKRDGYNFVEWNTNSDGTGTKYAAGASYTANAAVTLYAIWELSYKPPRITNFSVTRCDAEGNTASSSTKYKLRFNWATDFSDPTLYVDLKATGTSEWTSSTIQLSGTEGAYESIEPSDSELNAELSYDVRIFLSDIPGIRFDSATKIGVVDSNYFAVDYLIGGKGAAFGKVAELEEYADFAFKTKHRNDAEFDNGKAIRFRDSNGDLRNIIEYLSNNYLYIGGGNYEEGGGNTIIYGKNVNLNIKDDGGDGVSIRPYISYATTPIDINIRTSGYVTNSGKDVYFTVPLSRPLLSGTIVTASTNNGFILRQDGLYTHGSSASVYAVPDSYEIMGTFNFGIEIKATFSNIANVSNNDAVGIHWSGVLTFS